MCETRVPTHLLRIGRSFEQTYQPVLEFDGWIVAMLRYFTDVSAANFRLAERHRTSNEVFVLTSGQADLIVFDGDVQPTDGYVIPMQLSVAYDVPILVWHWVIMSPDAHIVLVERNDTTDDTTDYAELTTDQVARVLRTRPSASEAYRTH